MTLSMMNFPTSQGGRSSMAAAAAAHVKVRTASRRYGLMNRRTRSRDFTAEYSVSFEALHSVQGDRSWLNDFGVFCPPVLLELFQLGERGEIGHSIEEELALQVVDLVLDADGIEARGVQLNGLAVTIEIFHPHPDRTSYLAAEPVDAETSLPALGGHRRVAQYLRVDQDGPREAVLPWHSMTTTCSERNTCGAARPMPSALTIVSSMSSMSSWKARLPISSRGTGSATCRNTGAPSFAILRTVIVQLLDVV